MSELRPCPFCGGEPSFKTEYGCYGYTPNVYQIGCDNCGVYFSLVDDFHNSEAENKAELIKMWNRRV